MTNPDRVKTTLQHLYGNNKPDLLLLQPTQSQKLNAAATWMTELWCSMAVGKKVINARIAQAGQEDNIYTLDLTLPGKKDWSV